MFYTPYDTILRLYCLQAKPKLYLDRLQLITQRMRRNRFFQQNQQVLARASDEPTAQVSALPASRITILTLLLRPPIHVDIDCVCVSLCVCMCVCVCVLVADRPSVSQGYGGSAAVCDGVCGAYRGRYATGAGRRHRQCPTRHHTGAVACGLFHRWVPVKTQVKAHIHTHMLILGTS